MTMSTKAMAVAAVVVLAMCAIGFSNAQAQPMQPGGAPLPQVASQPANNASAPAGPAPMGLGQAGGPAPINKIISPPSSGLPAPTQTAGANTNLVDPVGGTRSKRQAGIPPVCCTKDPCDPCATTPCIACPLCG